MEGEQIPDYRECVLKWVLWGLSPPWSYEFTNFEDLHNAYDIAAVEKVSCRMVLQGVESFESALKIVGFVECNARMNNFNEVVCCITHICVFRKQMQANAIWIIIKL